MKAVMRKTVTMALGPFQCKIIYVTRVKQYIRQDAQLSLPAPNKLLINTPLKVHVQP
jgi:hypothetical protein